MSRLGWLLAKPAWARYGLALGLASVEVFVRAHLTPAWGTDVRLITFSPAVLLAAWLGGPGPGPVATAVGASGASCWLAPAGSPVFADAHDRVALVLLVAVGVVTSGVVGRLHVLVLRQGSDRAALAVERALLVEREREAHAAADAANRAKDQSLAIVGHEIRTPLAAISTAVRVLDRSGIQERDAAPLRAVIIRETEQLARIVDDLLDLGRMTGDKIVLDRRPVDLAAAVRRCLDTLGAAGRTSRHVVEVAAEPVWIGADPVRLEQVLVNLLVNALKYTPAGGSIRITVRREPAGAVLEVQDSGTGIAPDVLPRVFDMFVQEDRTRTHSMGGLGIGLPLVRRLVELHGGTVQASSDGPGRGSTLTVCLPEAPAAPAEERARPATPAATPRRVVMIEDNRDAREALRHVLEHWGNEVYEAEDGREGVELSLQVHPEVVLIDVGLPAMDGYEVARRIRAAPESHGILLVALTGYARPEDRERSRRAGFDVHLVKPVGLDDLAVVFESAPERAGRPSAY